MEQKSFSFFHSRLFVLLIYRLDPDHCHCFHSVLIFSCPLRDFFPFRSRKNPTRNRIYGSWQPQHDADNCVIETGWGECLRSSRHETGDDWRSRSKVKRDVKFLSSGALPLASPITFPNNPSTASAKLLRYPPEWMLFGCGAKGKRGKLFK